MAHTFDTSALIAAGTSNPQAVNYTCGAGATLLVVALAYANGTRTGAPTYNGMALTQADQVRKAATSPEACAEIWYLLDPPTGSAYSLSVPNPNALSLEVCISSYKASSGCKSVFDTATGNQSNSGANPSVTITTTGTSVIVAVLADGYATAPTNRTGTSLYETGHTTWDSAHQYFLQSAEGAKAMGWTLSADDWGVCVAGFHERGTGVDVSKAAIYGVIGPQQGVNISKAATYGVVGPQQGVNISKAVIYAVIQTEQRVSQFVEEVVTGGVGNQRVSQFVPEAITGGVGSQRVSQFVWEAIVDVQGVKVSQFPVEVVWGQATPLVDVSQFPVEVVWGQATPLVDISQYVVEVITSPPATFVSQAPVNVIWGNTVGTADVSQMAANVIWSVAEGTAQVSQVVVSAIVSPYTIKHYAEAGSVVIDGQTIATFTPGISFVVHHYAEPGNVVITGLTKAYHHHKRYAEPGEVVIDGQTIVDRTSMTWTPAVPGDAVIIDGQTNYVSRVNIALRDTQTVAEVLALDEAGMRTTQVPAEILALNYAQISNTQTPAEVLLRNNAEILNTQTVAEVLVSGWRRKGDFWPVMTRILALRQAGIGL